MRDRESPGWAWQNGIERGRCAASCTTRVAITQSGKCHNTRSVGLVSARPSFVPTAGQSAKTAACPIFRTAKRLPAHKLQLWLSCFDDATLPPTSSAFFCAHCQPADQAASDWCTKRSRDGKGMVKPNSSNPSLMRSVRSYFTAQYSPLDTQGRTMKLTLLSANSATATTG